jgi:hypothetical protein
MHFSFNISSRNLAEFVEHWSAKYQYQVLEANSYTKYIGKPLTIKSLQELYIWKNGGPISKLKLKSIKTNYPINPPKDLEARYLNHKNSGGAIWNIFYLHCVSPSKYPIFDQHNFRAMRYLKNGEIEEIPKSDKLKYSIYINEFKPFFLEQDIENTRDLDKALFAFGQFLNKAQSYT